MIEKRHPSSSDACRQCGSCCRWEGHVLLADGDIARLAQSMGLAETDFIDRYTRLASNRAQLSLQDGPDGACCFLRGDRCSVYEHRPGQCRDFPRVWTVAGGCPGSRL